MAKGARLLARTLGRTGKSAFKPAVQMGGGVLSTAGLNLLPSPGRMQQQIDDRQYRGILARRYGSYHDESRGGEHTSRSGTPRAGTSTPGPSAQIKPRTSRKKPRGMISRANRRGAPTSGRRRPRTVRYRKGGCPPGYRYDRRRRMCVLTK